MTTNEYSIAVGIDCPLSIVDDRILSKQCRHIVNFDTRMGSAYLLIIDQNQLLFDNNLSNINYTFIPLIISSTPNILWLLPQHFLATMGSVVVWTTTIEFCYSEVADGLKSVMQVNNILLIKYCSISF